MPNRPTTSRPARPLRATATRPTARKRGYTSDWEKASKVYLTLHPLCECDDCTAAGRLTPAEVVDHTIAHRGNWELFWDEGNWRAMAKRCHDRKTGRGQ